MKKQLLIFTILLTFNLLSSQNKGNSVIGKWIGTDERTQTAGIEFSENGKAKLLMYGKEMPHCDYKVNYDKDPIAITLVTKPKGKEIILYGLIKFIDADTIKWEVFPVAEKQPNEFSNNAMNTSIILKRNK
jgi:hypothetical protein